MADQYSSVERFDLNAKKPGWIHDDIEGRRVAAYGIYEDIYWSQPEIFKVVQHDAERPPVYLPSGKTIVETMNRHLAPDPTVTVNPDFGTSQQQELAAQMIDDIMKRERYMSQFNKGKRGGVIRGDWAWQIYADDTREEGSKVSVTTLHPGTLFPIHDPNNIDVIIGWHIAEAIIIDDETVISRKTYRKVTEAEGPSPITYEHAIFETDNWGGPGDNPAEIKKLRQVVPPTELPAPIDHLPIYLIPNQEDDGTIWGSSEMRGLETMFNSQMQNVSDEDVALALDGLGLYWTDGGTPVDADGNEVPWNMGPGRVAEVPSGRKMGRLEGLGTVEPYQSHVDWLQRWAERGRGISDIATGQSFDVTVAESGVALAIRLAPIISTAEEREQTITDKQNNLWYDLKKWFTAFEGGGFASIIDETRIEMQIGSHLPLNQEKYVQELMALATTDPPIVSTQYVRDELRRLGREMPEETEMVGQIVNEQTAAAQLAVDVTSSRLGAEEAQFE